MQYGTGYSSGVNQQGEREILGFDVGMSEDGAFWIVSCQVV